MLDREKSSEEATVPKKTWRKPKVKTIKAGSAENRGRTGNDGVPSQHINS